MGIPVKSLKRLTAGFAKLVLGEYVSAPVKVLGGELIDLVKDQIPDEGDQWETTRRFDDIAARIVRRVVKMLDEESEQTADLDTEAVAQQLAITLEQNTTVGLVLDNNFDPEPLSDALLAAGDEAARQNLPAAGQKVHRAAVIRSARYVVDTLSLLPEFQREAIGELNTRLLLMGGDIDEALDLIQRIERQVAQSDRSEDEQRWEADYRQALLRNLDKVELFGADIPNELQRNQLTDAFVSLNIEQPGSDGKTRYLGCEAILDQMAPLADSPNCTSRLLVRGAAGVGKTTLVRWIAIEAAKASFLTLSSQHDRLNEEEVVSLAERLKCRTAFTDRDGKLLLSLLAPTSESTPVYKHSGLWRMLIPFLIPLRFCQEGYLPAPDKFPSLVAKEVGTPRENWVRTVLQEGRGLVLIDGVDEVPPQNRAKVREEVAAIISAYPQNIFILTTRPEAVGEDWSDWLSECDFTDSRVSPMSDHGVVKFIHTWHKAVGKQLRLAEEPLAEQAATLIEKLRETEGLWKLATNPLLCAMICALNRHTHQKLPDRQWDICEALCLMLLFRRERESGLDWEKFPEAYRDLDYDQRQSIVMQIARLLVDENTSAMPFEKAKTNVALKLNDITGRNSAEAGTVLTELIVRSGLLREPSPGQVDFLHNTFKEFLAGISYAQIEQTNPLVEKALSQEDPWQRVLVFAVGARGAGDSQSRFATAVLQKLLDRLPTEDGKLKLPRKGSKKWNELMPVFRLLITCHRSAREYDGKVQARVEPLLTKPFPPRTLEEGEALAVLGQAGIEELEKGATDPSATTAAACVRALRLIGSRRAQQAIESFFHRDEDEVLNELAQAVNPLRVPAILRLAETADIGQPPSDLIQSHVTDLSPLKDRTGLTQLNLHLTAVSDLTPISHLTVLERLGLSQTQVSDLSPLAQLTSLQTLYLYNTQVSDVSPLARLNSLQTLNLRGTQVSDMSPLAQLTSLQTLYRDGTQVSDEAVEKFHRIREEAGLSKVQFFR